MLRFGKDKITSLTKLLKVSLLLFVFEILVFCDWNIDSTTCTEDALNNKISFGKYYSDKNIIINYQERDFWDLLNLPYNLIDSSRYSIYELSFYEDSSFSYLKIWHQKNVENIIIQDTTMILNGKVKIIKDGDLPWYAFELNADYIYEKEIKDSLGGILYFTDFSRNKFKGFENKFFTNIKIEERKNVGKYKYNVTDTCFTLYEKSSCMPDNFNYPCISYKRGDCYWKLFRSKIFCLEQQQEEIQTNSIGDRFLFWMPRVQPCGKRIWGNCLPEPTQLIGMEQNCLLVSIKSNLN